MIARRPPLVYLAAVGAVFLAAWAWGAAHGPFDFGDTEGYLQQADNLSAGAGWSSGTPEATEADPRLASRRLPGYGAFLAAVRLVSGSHVWLGLVQSLLGVALWWGLWRVAVRIGPDVRWPLALGLALAPAAWIVAQAAMSDLVFAALLFVATERVVAFADLPRIGVRGRRRSADLAWAHVALALGFLVKPVLLYAWPLALGLTAWMLVREKREGERGKEESKVPTSIARGLWPAALAGIIPLLALGLAAAHEAQTGHAEVTSLQTQNLWQQNARRAMLRTGDEAEYEATDARLAAIPTYADRQRQTAQAAKDAIFERPLAYAAVHLQGVAAFALDPGRFDLAVFFELPVGSSGGMDESARGLGPLARFLAGQALGLSLVLGLLLAWNAAVAVAFLAWAWRGAAPPEVRLWCLLFVAYLAAVTGPVGSARYRLAVVPILLLALPWAWDSLRSRFAS